MLQCLWAKQKVSSYWLPWELTVIMILKKIMNLDHTKGAKNFFTAFLHLFCL